MSFETALILVIAVLVATLVEIVKHFVPNLGAQHVQLMALLFGVIGGLLSLWIFGGTFADFVTIGVTAGIASTGVYEFASKAIGGN